MRAVATAVRRRRAVLTREELQPLAGEPVEVVTDDGALLHVQVDPADTGPRTTAGPTVVLCHGYGLSADAWCFQRLALRGRHRLVLPEHRGHGRSGPGPAGPVTLARLADDLAHVLDAVAPEGPLVLVGHCLGGAVVLELATRRPDLLARTRAVGLVATSAGGTVVAGQGLPLLRQHLVRRPELERAAGRDRRAAVDVEQRLVRHWSFASPVSGEVLRLVARTLAGTSPQVAADLLPALTPHDQGAALHALAGRPVLVLTAERDLVTPAEHGRALAGSVPGAEHVLVRSAGHLVPLEHPAVVTSRLERLLRRAADDGAAPAAEDEVVLPLPEQSPTRGGRR